MTDLDHLKESYSEMRRDMKLGYGKHSFERQTKDLRDLSKMVDLLPIDGNNRMSKELREEIKSIVKGEYVVTSKKSVKTIINYLDNYQLLLIRDVVKRGCRKD